MQAHLSWQRSIDDKDQHRQPAPWIRHWWALHLSNRSAIRSLLDSDHHRFDIGHNSNWFVHQQSWQIPKSNIMLIPSTYVNQIPKSREQRRYTTSEQDPTTSPNNYLPIQNNHTKTSFKAKILERKKNINKWIEDLKNQDFSESVPRCPPSRHIILLT